MVGEDRLAAQEAVIGSMLFDDRCIGEVLEQVREEDFSSAPCRLVFQAIKALFAEGGKADPVTVLNKLGAAGNSEMRGYLLQLMEITPTAANVQEYARTGGAFYLSGKAVDKLSINNYRDGLITISADVQGGLTTGNVYVLQMSSKQDNVLYLDSNL